MANTVDQSFLEFKKRLNITDLQQTTVSQRQNNVRNAIAKEMTVLDSFLTGSYSRSTMVSPLKDSDIDIFIVLDPKYYYNYNGQNGGQGGLLDCVKRNLCKTYTTPDVSRNGQAVTISFTDFAVDIVPAFNRSGGGYLIPNSMKQNWIETDPKRHVSLSSSSNIWHKGDYVPLVKMIKSWNKMHSNFFRSFHLEVLALKILENVIISDFPSGIRYFFEKGIGLIDKINPDPSGYGDDVGYYLNTAEKIQDAVARFERAYKIALEAEDFASRGYVESAISKWRVLFNNYFPAYG